MPARILLLEGDHQLAKNFQTFLTKKGYIVFTHSDLQQAILDADKNPPDLVVLDLMLANRSGVEFLYELRSYPEWQNIPAIALGRLPQDEQESYSSAFAQLNVSAYLHKPTVSLNQLSEEIEKLLQPAVV